MRFGPGEGIPPRLEVRHVAVAIVISFDLLVVLSKVGIDLLLARAVLAFLLTAFVLGGLFLLAIGVRPDSPARWSVYVVGTSLVLVMAIGFVLNGIGLFVGDTKPLSSLPLTLGVNLAVLAMSAKLHYGHEGDVDVASLVSSVRIGPQPLFLALFPLWSILSVTYLNVTGTELPLVAVLVLLAVVPMTVTLRWFDERYFSLAILSTAAAVLLHKSLWLGETYGGHKSVVVVWEQGYWTGAGETLLVNAVLMPSLAHLSGLPIITYLKVVMPLFVAFLPVAAYATFERYTDPIRAFLGSALLVFMHPFYFQYPNTPRASMPVLFLVLLGTALSDPEQKALQRKLLAVLFASGIVVAHYGTSYFVMFAIGGALAMLWMYRPLDRYVGRLLSTPMRTPDGGHVSRTEWLQLRAASPAAVLTETFGIYYLTAVTSWYFYVGNSSRFITLVEQIRKAYISLFVSPGGSSSTVTRLQTTYSGTSIGQSKYLYLMIAMLMGVGVLLVYYRRFMPGESTPFDDEYLALSSSLIAVFGVSLLISGQWGGGRPMMIVFSLGAIYPVLGMVGIGDTVGRMWASLTRMTTVPSVPNSISVGESAFAVVLAAFFVLNSGVVAATAYGGEAPSNVPNTAVDSINWHKDVQAHAWLADHRNTEKQIYGDRLAWAQATDWHNGEITAVADNGSYRFRPKYNPSVLNASGLERGYVILVSLNIVAEQVKVNYITFHPISSYDMELDQRNRVYANDAAQIYHTGNDTIAMYERTNDSAGSVS